MLAEEVATALADGLLRHDLAALLAETLETERLCRALVLCALDEAVDRAEELKSLSEQLFESLLTGLVGKEAAFHVRLERDAEEMLGLLLGETLDSCLKQTTLAQYVPLAVQDSLFLGTTAAELRAVAADTIAVAQVAEAWVDASVKALVLEVAGSLPEKDDKVTRHLREKSSVLVALPEVKKADPVLGLYVSGFIAEAVRRFAADIVTAIVLPHKVYKRVMTRVVRKTTYLAIQQAVDLAYRLEEDTITLADRLLDQFVEGQIREMVMLYPNNQLRRSHTILIDASTLKGKPASVPVTQPPPHVSVPVLPSPVKKPEEQPRTRNQPMAQPLTAINNFLRTGQPQPQNFMFISEEDLQTNQRQAEAARQTSQKVPSSYSITRQVNPQSHTNQRYEAFSEASLKEGYGSLDDEMGYIEPLSLAHMEENKGKQVPHSYSQANYRTTTQPSKSSSQTTTGLTGLMKKKYLENVLARA